MKTCPRCGLAKPTSAFQRASSTRDGLQVYCTECKAAYRLASRQQARSVPPEKDCTSCGATKPAAQFYSVPENRTGLSSRCKQCLSMLGKNRRLQRLYGIDEVTFAEMKAEQGDRCAICDSTESRSVGTFHVDHCHSTGRVRGLLCGKCNMGLGQFDDDPRRLRRAANYVAGVSA